MVGCGGGVVAGVVDEGEDEAKADRDQQDVPQACSVRAARVRAAE